MHQLLSRTIPRQTAEPLTDQHRPLKTTVLLRGEGGSALNDIFTHEMVRFLSRLLWDYFPELNSRGLSVHVMETK